ncbi:MAG: hypothetical protein A2157_12060 [Deltaproteobacteria bacterium RBG_16_47_11]|nr:MAG: hypothetical protein A2157_12060 [Deltaproteobacteria bacterium RBG_16_47_11]
MGVELEARNSRPVKTGRNPKQFEAPRQHTELPGWVVSILLLRPYRALCRPNDQNTKFKTPVSDIWTFEVRISNFFCDSINSLVQKDLKDGKNCGF